MAALAVVLSGLALGSGSKILWDKYRKIPVSTPYDVVIRINSLAALAIAGWEIILGQNTRNVDSNISTVEEKCGVVVSVLGSYNRGKSFILNQLCDLKLPNGNLIHTEGISITAGRNQVENVIFIDTAGTDTAIAKDKLEDKKATEALLREIALHLSSYVVIVVNRLRATDQSYIQQVLNHCKNSTPEKYIIIIHNLMDVESIKDVDEIIKYEVENLFEAKPVTMKLQMNKTFASVNLFCSTNNGMNLRHFILAKNDSAAANKWNRQSIDGLMNIFQTVTDRRRNLDVVNETINFVNTKLPHLFNNHQNQDTNSAESNQQKIFQVQQHANQPFIVLSHRKDMDDLNKRPDELTLSPKLLYDDAGYFIGISSMDNGQWQPRHDLYETNDELYAVIELPGFKKSEARVQILEQAIIIEGCRNSFKESLTSLTVHQQNLPIGKFKLEIPLQCQIDPGNTKLERDEGFFKVICPKKKITAVYLE